MAEHKDKVYRVREPFSFDHEGRPYSMRTGDIISESHPAFSKGRLPMLEEVTTDATLDAADTRRAVETATAVPGERRSGVRPARTV